MEMKKTAHNHPTAIAGISFFAENAAGAKRFVPPST
jgi:hypothetical protein